MGRNAPLKKFRNTAVAGIAHRNRIGDNRMSDVLEISSFILAGVLVLAISWALRGKWRRLENRPAAPAIRPRR
jgi:hypothetical protein